MRKPTGNYETREQWLQAAIDKAFRPWLQDLGITVPDVLISMGYGPGMRAGGKVLAVCYVNEVSGGRNTIFVIPETADLVDILDSVLHELIHACDNCKSGHKGFFAETAAAVGFCAPFTATPLTDELRGLLERLAADLGPFGGHRKFDLASKTTITIEGTIGSKGPKMIPPTSSHGKPQQNRWRKAECVTAGCAAAESGYKVRMSRSMADAFGAPRCPACDKPMTIEEPTIKLRAA